MDSGLGYGLKKALELDERRARHLDHFDQLVPRAVPSDGQEKLGVRALASDAKCPGANQGIARFPGRDASWVALLVEMQNEGLELPRRVERFHRLD